MNKRLNITLPDETIALIDRVTAGGDRSRLIDEAVHHYVDSVERDRLRKQLREGASVRAERDLRLSEEWFHLKHEASPESDK